MDKQNNQLEAFPNYDEYNQNNRLVNDVNYSYYYHKNKNLKNNNNENNTNTNSNNNSINKDLNESNNNSENDLNSSREQIYQNSNNNTLNNTKNRLSTPYNNNYNYQKGRISSTMDIKENERERKKILLDNIQTQINLRRKTKLEELEKQKEEDVKYLKEMIEGYPFGRGGGGAPNRNKKGDVQAFRRNLISDMRYNQSDINVDDDFDEVRRTKKNYNFKNDNININNNINDNKYNPLQKSFSNFNNYKINNNINKYNNMSSSYDFRNYNKDLDTKIYERRMKQLELQKEQEEIKSDELKEENNQLEKDLYIQTHNNKLYKSNNNKIEEENDTTTDNNTNNINYIQNKEIPINRFDYYDNINFVPKGQIHPRLDNNFLFSEELSKLKQDIAVNQNSLMRQISKLKDETLLAQNERNKVYQDLNLIKFQLDKLKKEYINQDLKNKEDNYINNYNNKENDTYIINNLERNTNDYDYIDELFFKKYENELPSNSKMTKNKNIFHLEKNYEDKNLIELDKLIKKSDDIMENFRENELFEKKFRKKPEDYFNTSDYYFYTYMKDHKDDYYDYANELNNKYNNYSVNNKFMEFDEEENKYNYEFNIEKI